MDPKRFDAMSQRLRNTGDRRQVLASLGALAALGLPAGAADGKKKARCVPVEIGCKRSPQETRSCKTCCSGCSVRTSKKSGRCVCCPDGVTPKGGSAVYCCSGYINTSTGVCQSTCAPTCAKCCPPPTGSTIPHCGTADQICCPTSLGGGACPSTSACCTVTAECPAFSTCINGCCGMGM